MTSDSICSPAMQDIAAACEFEITEGRGLRAKDRGHFAAGQCSMQ